MHEEPKLRSELYVDMDQAKKREKMEVILNFDRGTINKIGKSKFTVSIMSLVVEIFQSRWRDVIYISQFDDNKGSTE